MRTHQSRNFWFGKLQTIDKYITDVRGSLLSIRKPQSMPIAQAGIYPTNPKFKCGPTCELDGNVGSKMPDVGP